MEEKDFQSWLMSDQWGPNTGDMLLAAAVPIYEWLLESDNGAFFKWEGSECQKVYASFNYSLEPNKETRFSSKMQSDFLMTKWRHPRLEKVHDNLKTLLNAEMFLEHAMPLAVRCALSAQEIDDNYAMARLGLTTFWDDRRNDATTMKHVISSQSQDLYHPAKLGLSMDHVDGALLWKKLTSV